MIRLGPFAAIIATIVSGALAGCARSGPPAPLSFPGGPEPGTQASPVAQSNSGAPAKPAKPQAAPPSPPATAAPQEHLAHPSQITIAKGETLYTISRRYDVPLRSIIDANHLDPPFQVAAGTRLDLPQERFHIVKPGDTLYGIARLYGVEVSTLASLNRLEPPYGLRAGETLFLPAEVEPPDHSPSAVAAAPESAAPGSKPDTIAGAPSEKPSQPGTAAAPTPELTRPIPPRVGKGFDWPVQGKIIERYGTGPNGTHNDGINIAAQAGEPVRAADAGVVAYAGNELRGYGNLVLIKHPGGYMTAYAHNSQLLVKRGNVVKRGQEIAKAGSTGTVDTPQVHFEIRQGTRAIDPIGLLPSIQASAR
ncbi:MAG TPA: LysM peptidoglycan-binding domain-containing M23 family metallopeptidase [Stellaceae bacterium]|jgi:murein DD-endopeptidase MepM/ murein hydrolase activator NlpD|nr:LysM peptidoglycan-binding domain-containing M23 family metallopeptidase [Stellaceae bacterium]